MVEIKRLTDKSQTGREMSRLVHKYHRDIDLFQVHGAPLSKIPLDQYFSIVSRLPYKKDSEPVEVVSRPYHLLAGPWAGWDCKKKAILIASYFENRNIPWRFVAVSSQPGGQIHHVIVQAKIDNEWVDIDATYPENELWDQYDWTAAEVLNGQPGAAPAMLVSMYGTGEINNESDQEFHQYLQSEYPEFMGDFGISAGAAALITGIIASITSTAIAVVQGIQNKKAREKAAKIESAQIALQESAMERSAEVAQTQTEQQTEQQKQILDFVKKYGIPVSIGAALLFFGS